MFNIPNLFYLDSIIKKKSRLYNCVQMNKLYHLGLLNETSLHLTPVQSILQMKPSFEYFDIYEKKVKDIRDSAQPNDVDLLF